MIKVKMIDHIVLRTDRRDDMIRFYSDVLGCRVERRLPAHVGLTQLRAGKSLIDIVEVDSELGRAGGPPPSGTEKSIDHFCLQIEAISEKSLSEWLESHGIEVGDFEVRYGAEAFGSSIYIRDPDNNIVELRLGRFRERPYS
ncbi:MAG: VOC family protein [Xanthomonadales bacterium]|nr:VOC family protein [Gammaproteobacteria bacterium]MBT8051327.1 VOC family protein [Gammaproteobacteria bacterium]MBT8057342.1 VOC family protein [Gammaproteobacteria bacterium]NNJ77771.1 VOC family protein [Xanthomonadales bacterium]NNL04690.1 VOC family protein [Xanthomonadales bacterium]